MCSSYDYVSVTAPGCMHIESRLDSTAATGNVLNIYDECFFYSKINYTYSPKTKNLQWQKKDFISKDTLHVRPLSIYTGQEEVA